MDKKILIDAGIDVEKAIMRFMGNEGLYAKMLKKFLDDANYENLVNAISEKNDDDALVASHTLKGLCGNLSMDKLYNLFSEQVVLMRADKWEEAYCMMPIITENYRKVTNAIKECFDN